jgi:hypothetical protein
MRANKRQFNGKQSYPIPVWSGLLEHRERMGSAIWEFIWCLDRITQEENGVGFVNGRAPVKAQQIARDFKTMGDKTVDEQTVRVNLKKLKEEGYLRLRRTPYGQVIEVMNSLKFGIWAPCKRTNKKPRSFTAELGKTPVLTRELRETTGPELRKTPVTKKTQQKTRSKENPLYKKEGFSEFWKEYPRGEDKEDAAKVWAKIDPEEHPRIMAGLRLWKRSRQWQKDGGQFIVYAVRFLKKKSWKEIPVDLQRQEAGQREEREMVKL